MQVEKYRLENGVIPFDEWVNARAKQLWKEFKIRKGG